MNWGQGTVAHFRNPSYNGGRSRKRSVPGLVCKSRPYQKNKLKTKGLGAWLKW
jgi:hypothetical protein